jgi:RimJ/RimL family protein N-acetyltransferase
VKLADDQIALRPRTEEDVTAITEAGQDPEIVDQNVQLGHWVKREARGRGVATRALRLI